MRGRPGSALLDACPRGGCGTSREPCTPEEADGTLPLPTRDRFGAVDSSRNERGPSGDSRPTKSPACYPLTPRTGCRSRRDRGRADDRLEPAEILAGWTGFELLRLVNERTTPAAAIIPDGASVSSAPRATAARGLLAGDFDLRRLECVADGDSARIGALLIGRSSTGRFWLPTRRWCPRYRALEPVRRSRELLGGTGEVAARARRSPPPMRALGHGRRYRPTG